jgi:guanylate kinase
MDDLVRSNPSPNPNAGINPIKAFLNAFYKQTADMTVPPKKLSLVSLPLHLRPVVISGPSGCGKSTLLKMLLQRHPTQFGYCVSHTTRQPREGEVRGVSYHFVEPAEFVNMINNQEFVEWTKYSSSYYGTSISSLEQVVEDGKIPILDIDLAGVRSIKALNTRIHARFIFVKTKNMEILEQRLRTRGTESEEKIQQRLAIAKEELAYAEEPGAHDFIIVNDDLQEAYNELETYIMDR